MIVTLIAATETFSNLPPSVTDTPFGEKWRNGPGEDGSFHSDLLSEFAGRSCYQSWTMPNPKTAGTVDYVKHIVTQQHESVLEHSSATFYIEGVSRSLTHELIRHRHLSYSELSQRYVDMSTTREILPPLLRDLGAPDSIPLSSSIREGYDEVVANLVKRGYARKQAREAARAILSNATETKIVVTGNMRAWRDFLKKRWHVAADREIMELAGEVLRQLRNIAPGAFADIPEVPYGTE